MDSLNAFEKQIEEAVKHFKELNDGPIRIISHLDADGISAASILVYALLNENIKFSLSIVRQLSQSVLNELSLESYQTFMFTDLGSGYLSQIEQALPNKTIFIFDHHKPENKKNGVIHINPHLAGIDGSTEISGSGVVYLFTKKLNSKNQEMAHIALIGAIGDSQLNGNTISILNQNILDDAISSNKIAVTKGLRMFGMQTRPLHKVLEYSTDPFIPNVTGSEKGALSFLNEIGIIPKDGNKWKKLIHLDQEDMKKLVTGIILKRLGSEKKPEDVLGQVFLLNEEEEESPTKDAKEFSTLLNACGRLNKPSLGIGTCLGSKETIKEALTISTSYKREIINSLSWFNNNKDKVISEKGFIIINAEENIKDTMIGTMASMIGKSNVYPENTIILALASSLEGHTKASIRKSGFKNDENLDLRKIIQILCEGIEGAICGGHKMAAGALIPPNNEEQFIENAKKRLSKILSEEFVK